MRRFIALRTCLLLLFVVPLLLTGACREIESDRLYALKLDHLPGEADWQRALPHLVSLRGGRPNRPDLLPEIDQDTVHTSTASCHHGASLPDPIEVELKAFYTDQDLFLRLSWADATRDDRMRQWSFDGKQWQSSGGLEDGFGIIWDMQARFADFTCSYACHLDDFGVQGENFQANNRMKLNDDQGRLDLWHWKAERTGRLGFADDRFIDGRGIHGDLPGELFRENSAAAGRALESAGIFSATDRPLYDYDGVPIGESVLVLGSLAPGYLTEVPAGDRADIAAASRYDAGRWTVILRRSLNTGSEKDVVFVPGDETGVAFGLSLMDNSLYEHYASTNPEYLALLPADR